MFSCGEKKVDIDKTPFDAENTPSVKTHNDTMYISDSGIIRYKMIAKTSLMYDQANDPYNFFPDGAYLEQYDSAMTVITTVIADSVWNYKRKQLWKLRGNVHITNTEGKHFKSDELYWDQKNEKIYSELFVEITEDEDTYRVYGFESNQQMTDYIGYKFNSEFYVKENPENDE